MKVEVQVESTYDKQNDVNLRRSGLARLVQYRNPYIHARAVQRTGIKGRSRKLRWVGDADIWGRRWEAPKTKQRTIPGDCGKCVHYEPMLETD